MYLCLWLQCWKKTWQHQLVNRCVLGNFCLQLLQNRSIGSPLLSSFRSIFHFLCHFLMDCQDGRRATAVEQSPPTGSQKCSIVSLAWFSDRTHTAGLLYDSVDDSILCTIRYAETVNVRKMNVCECDVICEICKHLVSRAFSRIQ